MIQVKNARENIEKRFKEREIRSGELFEKATRDFSAITDSIISNYKSKRIYQWGSLLHPEKFNEHSDIDIAVDGITEAETFFRLLGDAMNVTKFRIDSIQMEKIEKEFADLIRLKGRVVYGGT